METQHFSSSDQSRKLIITCGGVSDKGPTRSENQDAFWIPDQGSPDNLRQLYLVADGVGGQESGADAAQLAVKTARDVFSEERSNNKSVQETLQTALQKANQAVFEESKRREVRRMGTTFVAAVVEGDHLSISHVGDARAYLIRQNEMRRLTRDDTWVQRQLEEGWITEEQAANHEYRNVVTQVLGNKPEVNVHLSKKHVLQPGDVVLLCSDGLYDVLTESHMLRVLTSQDAQIAAQTLIDDAVKGEASDNITAVVIKVQSVEGSVSTAAAAPIATSLADQPTVALSSFEPPTSAVDLADQPTASVAPADQPTQPSSPQPASLPPQKEESGAPNWLVILAVTAVVLIAAALFFFWMQNRDLENTVETAAGENMTASVQEVIAPTEAAGALRPAPTEAGEVVVSSPEPATEVPPPTPTLFVTLTEQATPQPRGCVNNEIVGFVWDSLQVETGNCDRTDNSLEPGQEIFILDDAAVIGQGSCSAAQYIRIQSASDPELEGWVDPEAIERIAPGESCGP